jgi:hypothetical protein
MKYPKTRKRANYGTMPCETCGAIIERRSHLQRYCTPCSNIAARKRGAKWANANGKRKYDETRTQYSAVGSVLSLAEKLDIASSTPAMPPMAWYRRVGVPFSWAGSKNHIFSNTSRGHIFMRDESRYMRSLITSEVMSATIDVPLVQNKLWIDIFAQKPRANGDAVNFVDLVCDAIKDGLDLDDRWYSIRSVDWQIAKHEPMLFIGLGQESSVNVQVCSSCGRLLTFDYFQRNKSLKHGIGRNCRDCMAVKSSSKKRDNARVQMAIDHGVGVFG